MVTTPDVRAFVCTDHDFGPYMPPIPPRKEHKRLPPEAFYLAGSICFAIGTILQWVRK